MNREELFEEWKFASTELSFYKEREMSLRKEIASMVLGDDKKGKETIITNGDIADVKRDYSYKIVLKDYEKNKDKFTEKEKDCVSVKYELSLSKYKKLSEEERKNLDECVETKPSAPTIKTKPVLEEE
jgi:hypothetical protein